MLVQSVHRRNLLIKVYRLPDVTLAGLIDCLQEAMDEIALATTFLAMTELSSAAVLPGARRDLKAAPLCLPHD